MPSHRGTAEPSRRKTGAQLGYHGKVRYVAVRCTACPTTGEEPIGVGCSPREHFRDVSCLNCGRLGTLIAQPGAA